MEESWWVASLMALESAPQRLEALTRMNTAIAKDAALPRHIIGRLISTPQLYDCASISGDSDKDPAVAVALELLGHCLDQLPLDTADENLPRQLGPGLAHSNPALRALVLARVLREVRRQLSAGHVHLLPNNELLFLILDELKQWNSVASSAAINILSIVLVQRLSDAGVHAKLVELLVGVEEVRCRAYELAVSLAKSNAASLSAVEFILDEALRELDNEDVLLQACVLEILVPLAEQNHGLSYLERRRVFDVISARVQCIDENPLDSLLIPSIMKFFGKVATVQPEKIITGYPHMLDCLFQAVQSEDLTSLPTALDTLANLASSPQGKVLLFQQFKHAVEESFKKYGSYTKTLPAPLKVRLLNSLDVIYTLEAPPTKQINDILETWYESFAGGAQADLIMELINTPFPDLQLAALGLLKTICKYAWGIVALRNTGGAVEFLLSRQKDLHKDVKFLKWEIMAMLAISSEFSPTETVRFTAYVNEGPFYLQANVNIATEPQGNA
ncbi:26S proteasome non-ATPase regulatory subunit 5 [Drosophila gunungcola]|uniref:26S proteasome non-ATPase regulatory subunit 5 n=1 Tax=Drosophila gunungcola TaxID=103775 RepID=A0A9P9YBE8_9MUSC|nr:26S proteasome non-ATPase regulatory subunit 5 [Drosophila gunungcola]XP_052856845.1 26S proteasome non-ATPase regulatory subunit 5 [Drosophila gunungcola]XP_052856846.1 26S proteasome non-ATPase regulatory subunit 5 [Drosophila gunungcola]KAI8033894.1 hypothetical protein M5D96_013349 [Drosophila gunungcola]